MLQEERANKQRHRAFPAPLRSSAFPRSLTDLAPRDRSKVARANVLADRAAILLGIDASRGLSSGEGIPTHRFGG